MSNLVFDISDIYRAEIGTRREFHLEVEEDFDPAEIVLNPKNRMMTADVTFLRSELAISVLLENFTYTIQLTCSRCLKKFLSDVVIKTTERDFLFVKPKDESDEQDIYLADPRSLEVDLHEMFRQEILLHFDAFPVCSPLCKGVCPVCGKDRNKAECPHKPVEQVETSSDTEESVQPFSGLKDMIKPQK